jgi:hypothetical protein
MLIDFTEIPKSNNEGKKQDIFEKFCREFLEVMGYEVISGPARGADGGIDIKVCEIRRQNNGKTCKFYWLVSCKHYAHSGKSITKAIETDIRDRVESHGCSGFIGLYSTIANQSLLNTLNGLTDKIDFQLYDNSKIESHLIGIHTNQTLLLRYFPKSYKKWKELYYYTEPIKLFENYLNSMKSYNEILLMELFQSTGNMIKKIRQFKTLKEALNNDSINYFVVPEFSLVNCKYVPLIEIYRDHVPPIIEKEFKIKVGPHARRFSWHKDYSMSVIQYDNRCFVSKTKHKELTAVFNHLKDMLK